MSTQIYNTENDSLTIRNLTDMNNRASNVLSEVSLNKLDVFDVKATSRFNFEKSKNLIKNKFDLMFEEINSKKNYGFIERDGLRNSPLKYFQNTAGSANQEKEKNNLSTCYSPNKRSHEKNKLFMQEQVRNDDLPNFMYSENSKFCNNNGFSFRREEENNCFVNRLNNILNYDIHNSDKLIDLYNLKSININTSQGITSENSNTKLNTILPLNFLKKKNSLHNSLISKPENANEKIEFTSEINLTQKEGFNKDPFNGFLVNLSRNDNNNLYLNKKRNIGKLNFPNSVNSVSILNTSNNSFNLSNTITTNYDYSNSHLNKPSSLNYNLNDCNYNHTAERFTCNINDSNTVNLCINTVSNQSSSTKSTDLNSKILEHFEKLNKLATKEGFHLKDEKKLEKKPKSILKIKTQEESLKSSIDNKPGLKSLLWKSDELIATKKLFLFTDEPSAEEVSKEEYDFIQKFISENSS